MARFIKASPYQCQVLAVCTWEESAQICNEFGFHSVIAENRPLGAKFNTGLKHGIDNIPFDYVILFGDDDIINNDAWHYYSKAIRQKKHYCGFSGVYFWHPLTKEAIWFDYELRYSKNKLIGCGRMMSKEAVVRSGMLQNVKVVKKITTMSGVYDTNTVYAMPEYRAAYLHGLKYARMIGEPYFGLWSNTQNNGLDHESEMRLLFNGYEANRFITDDKLPLMVDIKTEYNIWPIGRFKAIGRQVNESEAKNILTDAELEYIERNKHKL